MATTKEKICISFYIGGDDLIRLQEFAAENGFSSTNQAGRALCMGAIALFPTWGVSREMIQTIANEIRSRLLSDTYAALGKAQKKIEEELQQLGVIPPESTHEDPT